VAFSPDGTRVITASNDKTARVWNAQTGQPTVAPLEHQDVVSSAGFSPDGTRVVTASFDDTAQVWDARTGQPVGSKLQHRLTVLSAAFSPDGTRVVTASMDGTARVWDAQTGQPVGAVLPHRNSVNSAAFSADGTRVVTASEDGTARVWDVMPVSESEAGILADAAEALSGYRVNEGGALVQVASPNELVTRLRQSLDPIRGGEPAALSALRWLFEDPWKRTTAPLSAITVDSYLTERLQRCTPDARAEAESHFLGHPLLLRAEEFCRGSTSSSSDKPASR
jgi:hypothetical protein